MATKIYTRGGDAGQTSLFGGERTAKDDIRVEAYGTVDELNAALGLLAAYVVELDSELAVQLRGDTLDLALIQSALFTLGAQLATPGEATPGVPALGRADVEGLEQSIDAQEARLPALTAFVLPGGSPASAQCHVCRTVVRRAERRVVTLAREAHVDPLAVAYLNRLSDYLFVYARGLARAEGMAEREWHATATEAEG